MTYPVPVNIVGCWLRRTVTPMPTVEALERAWALDDPWDEAFADTVSDLLASTPVPSSRDPVEYARVHVESVRANSAARVAWKILWTHVRPRAIVTPCAP